MSKKDVLPPAYGHATDGVVDIEGLEVSFPYNDS